MTPRPAPDRRRHAALPGMPRGGIPEGFDRAAPGPALDMLVARGLDATELASRILAAPAVPAHGQARYFGRAGLHAVQLPGGDGLIRSYRHGGVLRGLTGGWFVSRPPRPFVELAVTVAARERGLAAPEVLAALVARGFGPWYRGWLVTRELKNVRDLWGELQREPPLEMKQAFLRRAGRSLRFMHARGIDHADLNLRNILVGHEGSCPEIHIIDFDKARLFPGPVPAARARRNLRRLLRSVNKLDPDRARLGPDDWSCLLDGYDSDG